MDTKALEKFCPWARLELIDAVDMRCKQYALDDTGRHAYPAGSDIISGIVGGRTLSAAERARRDTLFERIEQVGYTAFCEQQAYRWFNRFAAIRYMEIHGFLPSGVRMLSNADEAFSPDCLRAADGLELPGLDAQTVFDLTMAGDDEELYRHIIVAQMNELAACLPTIFGPVSSADALTLPNNLLMRNDHNVLLRLVEDIPRSCWQNVEVLGWMYQFYNSELKQAFLDSKRKAAIEDIAPATQVFTPNWIVHYMVENTLGRLWMLNNPNSALRNKMPYYIGPDGQNESFTHISDPEDITFCDPACGSGHILVYAFNLLAEMYLERGYREREIPTLILTKNLSGIEIDERAAQIAAFALAMCACDHDKRFLRRGIVADIEVLESIELDTDSLPHPLATRSKLVESLAHLSEIGSLFNPDETDLRALDATVSALSQSSLFEATQANRLATAKRYSEALSRSFDVVVANPPYMGSSRFNSFMSKWIKDNYPDEKSDLCYAFINRICGMKRKSGDAGIAATNSWMFLSSSEASRLKVLSNNDISSLVQLSVHGYKGIAAQVFAFTLIDKQDAGYRGGYVRLNNFDHHSLQEPKTLEAIANPDCGWFYRSDASTFHDIPGSPIAYWASEAMHEAFCQLAPLSTVSDAKQGLATGDNKRFVRLWWENPLSDSEFNATSREHALETGARWFPLAKGGEYRKWCGNLIHTVDWLEDGKSMKEGVLKKYPYLTTPDFVVKNQQYYFREGITWSAVSSSFIHLRHLPQGCIFDHSGDCVFSDCIDLESAQALLNSSVGAAFLSVLAPTLSFDVGPIGKVPFKQPDENSRRLIVGIVKLLRNLSKTDWDTQETSWGFKRNPLI